MRGDTPCVLDFGIGFEDRQRLQQIEDLIIDLQVILPVAVDNVRKIRDACKKCCQRHCPKYSSQCECDIILDRFDEVIAEIDLHRTRTAILQKRATAISKMVRTVQFPIDLLLQIALIMIHSFRIFLIMRAQWQ